MRNGDDKAARREMMICALEGAMAFQKGLGAVHALTHPLGAIRQLNLHHGTLNAVLMPAVLRFNRGAIGGKWERLELILGAAPDVAVARLNARLGMPTGLAAMGVTEDMLGSIAGDAMKDHCHATNPRAASPEDYLAIMREAL
jgi:alcohol dehydrogenase class IV